MIAFLLEFFKIGTFTYGGGLAMIPILRAIAVNLRWLTDKEFTDLIAISQSTPGPIAINMATYIGFRQYGVLGAVSASLVIILPAFVMAIALGRFLRRYNKHPFVKAAFVGLKAVVIGLIATAIVQVSMVSLYGDQTGYLMRFWRHLDPKALALLAAMMLLIKYTQKHPLLYILIGGICGIVFWH